MCRSAAPSLTSRGTPPAGHCPARGTRPAAPPHRRVAEHRQAQPKGEPHPGARGTTTRHLRDQQAVSLLGRGGRRAAQGHADDLLHVASQREHRRHRDRSHVARDRPSAGARPGKGLDLHHHGLGAVVAQGNDGRAFRRSELDPRRRGSLSEAPSPRQLHQARRTEGAAERGIAGALQKVSVMLTTSL